MVTITIGISGMHCEGCVISVVESLSKVDGIENLSVSLEAKNATISFNPEKASPDKFKHAIEDAGFDII